MKVSLVGAGPGDPGLLTVRGREILSEADVIVYDALANPDLLNLAKPGAELIYVGKIADRHALPQAEINRLLVKKAREKGHVARLKGGDPYIFGRGGEEGEYIVAEGVKFEEVPGITSAIAAPAYAGIPLTHRDFVSSLTIITGHEKPDKSQSSHDWDAFVKSGATLVFVMGVKNLPNISANLLAAGMKADTPAAIIYRGTTPMQRSVFTTISELPEKAASAGIANPAVIVVGKVTELACNLGWFTKKPLFGRRIVITRSREQASSLTSQLTDLGAAVIEFPTIQIEPLDDYSACDACIDRLNSFDWLIFTSVNGVKWFWSRLRALGKDSRSLCSSKVAAIGPATADSLKSYGIWPDLVPDTYVAEDVAQAILEAEGQAIRGMRILLPRAKAAREALPGILGQAGADVTVVPVYETVPSHGNVPALQDMLANDEIDCIAFGSSSTVRNFLALIPAKELASAQRVQLAAIGPVTAGELRAHGLNPAIQPENYTIPGLVAAICNYYAEKTE